ncbi:uncharacterized protein LOC124595473 [Schistocerca americana]|uniref:uncharacterized protein LOC124595473 n=1 Tax=Schistocerca americana TaxID=7009 RepID=UPI001F4F5469|nr:uncharacterized protein LOC124595473 [Schistocerca americana]
MRVNNKIITDKTKIANILHNNHTDAIEKLKHEYNSQGTEQTAMTDKRSQSMYLKPASEKVLTNVMKKLKTTKPTGHDEVSNYLIKHMAAEIITPLLDIANCSFQERVFPDKLKLVKVVPVYRKGKHDDPNNNRAVFSVSGFSKILEILMLNGLTAFLVKHKVIIPARHGYQ